MNVEVLRFEDSRRQGPYRGEHWTDYSNETAQCVVDMLREHNGSEAHPEPTVHGEPWYDEGPFAHEVCGFSDLDQLCNWFDDKLIEAMLGIGLQLVSYVVPQWTVRYGAKQVVFDPRQAFHRTVVLDRPVTQSQHDQESRAAKDDYVNDRAFDDMIQAFNELTASADFTAINF